MKILGPNAKDRCAAAHLGEKNGGKITMDEGSYINAYSFLRADRYDITIGKNCKISDMVHLITYYGSYYCAGSREKKNGPIIIEDNVWIGHGAMVRGGVSAA